MCLSQVCAFVEHKQNISIPFSWSSSHLALVAKQPKISYYIQSEFMENTKKRQLPQKEDTVQRKPQLLNWHKNLVTTF